ncbi:MAG: hypothetical protein ACI3XR_01580 [Eubacteriales bacterium]
MMEQTQEIRAERADRPMYEPPTAVIHETAGADVVLLSVCDGTGHLKESRWRW